MAKVSLNPNLPMLNVARTNPEYHRYLFWDVERS